MSGRTASGYRPRPGPGLTEYPARRPQPNGFGTLQALLDGAPLTEFAPVRLPSSTPAVPIYRRTWLVTSAAVVVALAVALALAVVTYRDSDTAMASPVATNNSQTGSASHAIRFNTQGQGAANTKKFTVHSRQWSIAYRFDCSQSPGPDNFQVFLYGDGASGGDFPANALAKRGHAVTPETGRGTYYLSVNTECSWNVDVRG